MRKAVVTGANGFIGSALIKELINNDVEVIALDLLGNCNNIIRSDKIKFYPFELSDMENIKNILMDCGADTFFHFAWSGTSGEERTNVDLQLKNIKWTVDSLKLAKDIGCSRYVNADSIMELETIEAVFHQGNRPGLGYIYGSGKLAAHTICKAVAANIKIDFLGAMITNAYGVGEKSQRMINTTIQRCIRGETSRFTAATQNYDFVYIDDVARAFRLIGEKGKPFNEYIIGSSNAKPLKEFLIELKGAIAPEVDFVFGDIPFTGIDLELSKFDCSKTEEDTGFRAQVSFREGCKRTRDWWLKEIGGTSDTGI